MRRRRLLPILVAAALCGCGNAGSPTGVATNPPVGANSGTGNSSNGSSPTPQTSGTRTVLAALGLNIRDAPARTANIIGNGARGTELTVLAYKADNGGWYQVKGQTLTGWITSDPIYTANGRFTEFPTGDKKFSALYPADWTFADSPTETTFRPQSGSASIAVRPAPTRAALGTPGLPNYTREKSDTVQACGYTGDLITYKGDQSAPQPTTDAGGGKVNRLPRFAQLWLIFDPSHALDIEANFATAAELQTFRDFVSGITYPYQLCQAQATPAPAPT
ncbi:MAG: SH3 domain-containing protein [Candidatus Dormibacteria bacterium]